MAVGIFVDGLGYAGWFDGNPSTMLGIDKSGSHAALDALFALIVAGWAASFVVFVSMSSGEVLNRASSEYE